MIKVLQTALGRGEDLYLSRIKKCKKASGRMKYQILPGAFFLSKCNGSLLIHYAAVSKPDKSFLPLSAVRKTVHRNPGCPHRVSDRSFLTDTD